MSRGKQEGRGVDPGLRSLGDRLVLVRSCRNYGLLFRGAGLFVRSVTPSVQVGSFLSGVYSPVDTSPNLHQLAPFHEVANPRIDGLWRVLRTGEEAHCAKEPDRVGNDQKPPVTLGDVE